MTVAWDKPQVSTARRTSQQRSAERVRPIFQVIEAAVARDEAPADVFTQETLRLLRSTRYVAWGGERGLRDRCTLAVEHHVEGHNVEPGRRQCPFCVRGKAQRALGYMRDGLTLTAACRRAGTSIASFLVECGDQVVKVRREYQPRWLVHPDGPPPTSRVQQRAQEALGYMREGCSMTDACDQAGITPASFLAECGDQLVSVGDRYRTRWHLRDEDGGAAAVRAAPHLHALRRPPDPEDELLAGRLDVALPRLPRILPRGAAVNRMQGQVRDRNLLLSTVQVVS